MTLLRKKWFRLVLIALAIVPWVKYYLKGKALHDLRVECWQKEQFYDLAAQACVGYQNSANQLELYEIYPQLFYGSLLLTILLFLVLVFVPSDQQRQ